MFGELYLKIGKDYRLRLHMHAGSTSEILQRFQDFGLSSVHCHAVFGGYVGNRPPLQAWMDERRAVEQAREAAPEDGVGEE